MIGNNQDSVQRNGIHIGFPSHHKAPPFIFTQ
jgi:hypothetical protein